MDFAPGDISRWAAVMAFDADALGGLIERGRADAGDRLAADLGRAWRALMRGEGSRVEQSLADLFARATAMRDPGRVVETTALRAMVALSTGQRADAVAFARRASLMARTEALPHAELLANLVLARVRRHSGKPHLAVRILEALARAAPSTPPGWLDWELLVAGGTRPTPFPPGTGDCDVSQAARAAAAGRALLLAARTGERASFEHAAGELARAAAVCADVRDEAGALLDLLDPERPLTGTLAEFRRGDDVELAYGLLAPGVGSDQEEPGTTIYVVAAPGRRGVRILRDGLGLFGPFRMLSSDDGPRRTHGRTDAGLAVLALASGREASSSRRSSSSRALSRLVSRTLSRTSRPWAPEAPAPPPSMPETDFFQKVYGFAYVEATHRGVLDVLVHRMRRRIDAAGTVRRAKGSLGLELEAPIAVADPRCSPPAAARVLSALARQPLATADVIAVRLGITVRAAQLALHQLVSDGACAMRRTGRAMEFQLQDSAFCEPTGSDVLAQSGPPPSG